MGNKNPKISFSNRAKHWLKNIIFPLTIRLGLPSIKAYLFLAEQIAGWMTAEELMKKAEFSYQLPDDAVVFEIGAFLGCSTVMLAGARKLKGSGMVHVIDPFDASGDDFSVPVYKAIEEQLNVSLLSQFQSNIRNARLEKYVTIHQGTSETIVKNWHEPIDMLILDGDQSPEGARTAFDDWVSFLKPGGILIVHNSADRVYEKDHDGHRRVVVESVRPPQFYNVICVRMTTFARKN
jgi:predicted O-methyltransferase YrrM